MMSGLSDLSGLSTLQAVGGGLSIGGNPDLVSVAGLEGLTSIGHGLSIDNNAQLTSLSGLSSLASVGASHPDPSSGVLVIFDNATLPACWTWMVEGQTGERCEYEDWYTGVVTACGDNTGTGSCGSLPPDFACVPGAVGPGVYDGDIQIGMYAMGPSLDELGGLTCVTGYLGVADTAGLTDLTALSNLQAVGGGLSIGGNRDLVSVAGLEKLTSIGHGLSFENNPQLTSLSGLSNLTSVGASQPDPSSGGLFISSNASLPACWMWMIEGQTGERCEYVDWSGIVTECYDNTGTGSCGSLPPDFACVPGAVGPGVYDGDIYIGTYAMGPELNELGGLTCVTGYLGISETAGISDLSALSQLQAVGRELSLFANPDLLSVAGLENLTRIGHHLSIQANQQLSTLAGMSNLTSLGQAPDVSTGNDPLYVFDNAALPPCWVLALETQTATTRGYDDWQGVWITCTGNDGSGSCTP